VFEILAQALKVEVQSLTLPKKKSMTQGEDT